MNTFVINEKEYEAKPFDFNLVCDMEDMGIVLEDGVKKSKSIVRAYFALCAGKDKKFAGAEMEAHIINGGTLDNIINAMNDEMKKSDFFRNLKEKQEAKAAENAPKQTEEK